MKCQSRDCASDADRVSYWPGQTTAMCGACAVRAAHVAKALGFPLVVGKLEDWPEYRKAAGEAADRLGAPRH